MQRSGIQATHLPKQRLVVLNSTINPVLRVTNTGYSLTLKSKNRANNKVCPYKTYFLALSAVLAGVAGFLSSGTLIFCAVKYTFAALASSD